MEYLFLLYIVSALFWPTVIIIAVIFFVRRRKSPHPQVDHGMQIALSREDAVSQWYLLLSLFFLGVTLISLNHDVGEPLGLRAILLVTTIVGFVAAYYFRAVSLVIFSLLAAAMWWAAQGYVYVEESSIRSMWIFAGLGLLILFYYSVGNIHTSILHYKRFGTVYQVLGVVAIIVLLFIMSTRAGLGLLEELTDREAIFNSWQATVTFILLTGASAGAVVYAAIKKALYPAEAVAVCFLIILFVSLAFIPPQSVFLDGNTYESMLDPELTSAGILWAILFNLISFFALLGLIFSGYMRKETWLINLGSVFLFLFIVIKYTDWFFTFLERSVFFIGAGLLLFGVGWFMEKGRRAVVANITAEKKSSGETSI